MFRVIIIGDGSERIRDLSLGLAEKGFLCSIACAEDERLKDVGTLSADLVVVAVDGAAPGSEMWDLPQRLKAKTRLPVVTLLSDDGLDVLDSATDVDDFVVEPWNASEVVARVRRILQRKPGEVNEDLICCGEVAIDTAKCEVAFKGRLVGLTFKEYELLKFLVTNKGKVFSREALLNKVWGYDYFGGDRTVDVHIRRLRSKLDESDCIETVRNIGYRFRDDT
ncbi:MAG: response regulator transcription factor [Dehalococcoidia bacterium]|nr:response regulator transcription factor [Dehalococcoidia bacterium]